MWIGFVLFVILNADATVWDTVLNRRVNYRVPSISTFKAETARSCRLYCVAWFRRSVTAAVFMEPYVSSIYAFVVDALRFAIVNLFPV